MLFRHDPTPWLSVLVRRKSTNLIEHYVYSTLLFTVFLSFCCNTLQSCLQRALFELFTTPYALAETPKSDALLPYGSLTWLT